jgi:hypothetical protein
MKICIKDNEFNPTLLYQEWCSEETAIEMGYAIIEVDEKYADCCFEDFNKDLTFDVEKYDARKQKEIDQFRIAEITLRLEKLDQDFRQADLGAIIPDIEERKAEFITLHNELRQLLGMPAREYRNNNLSEN